MTCSSPSTAQCGRELSEMLLKEITWVLRGGCITAVSFKSRLKEGEMPFLSLRSASDVAAGWDVSTGLCRCCLCWDRVLAVVPGMQAARGEVCSRAWGGQRKPQSHVCWAIQIKMKISVFEPSTRQQGIILFLMFLSHYLLCYSAAAIVLILWGLLKGGIICNEPNFSAHL